MEREASPRQGQKRDVVLETVRSTLDLPTADCVYRQARREHRVEEEARRAPSCRIVDHELEVHGLCPLRQQAGGPIANRSH